MLLQWHGIDTTNIKTNAKRLKKWLKLKDTAPPSVPKWTLKDEAEIAKLESPDIHMIVNPACYEAWREDDWVEKEEKEYGHLLEGPQQSEGRGRWDMGLSAENRRRKETVERWI